MTRVSDYSISDLLPLIWHFLAAKWWKKYPSPFNLLMIDYTMANCNNVIFRYLRQIFIGIQAIPAYMRYLSTLCSSSRITYKLRQCTLRSRRDYANLLDSRQKSRKHAIEYPDLHSRHRIIWNVKPSLVLLQKTKGCLEIVHLQNIQAFETRWWVVSDWSTERIFFHTLIQQSGQ
jgi:hypothetical protein